MKKICFISDRNPYMKRFCTLLSAKGYEIALICRHKTGISKDQFPDNLKFFQLSSTSLFTKFKEIPSFIDSFNADIVHLHSIANDCLIPALRRRKYKYYISIWGSDINIYSKKLLNRIIQNIGLILCDKIHLLSNQFEKKLYSLYFFLNKEKIWIFSWGIEYKSLIDERPNNAAALRKEFNIPEDEHIILSYRNHKEVYNHHTLIKSIPIIIQNYPKTKFIFTQSSFDEEYLKQSFKLVKDLEVNDHFICINRWLNDAELQRLINIADINVNIPFEDGLPATLFEIMTTKSVPIASNLENYHTFFIDKKNGFYLYNMRDEKELAQIILNVLENIDLYKKLFHDNNINYIRAYQDWDKQSQLFLDFYSEVILSK